eukprot:TRINITY_DN32052_c0_g1_i1.p1 TRINITY_DN32052_c0_g1~~TRINITY_DN32052_c0_g1_i1.p1  ORF type:complete len:350 (+),score=189.88 TRINITY_DN32052_c0_g1_i1:109-1158(+)
MADKKMSMQQKLDSIMDRHVNEHGEAREQLHKDVDALFEELPDADKVALFKYLPAALTTKHITSVLAIEQSSLPEAGVSKVLKHSLADMEFATVDDKKKALLLLYECLANEDSHSSQAALISFLQLFTSENPNMPASSKHDIEQLAATAILNHLKYGMKLGQEPASWQFDTICGLRPVRDLQTSRKREYVLLYNLLNSVFASGKCSEYMSFYAQNKELIESTWGLKNETLTSKVRTLALCTLCSESPTVSYSSIAAGLCIGTEEVEKYVIDAMSLDLLNAKIDSMAESILVKSVHHPLLETTHWNNLSDKLLSWYDAVSTLVSTLDGVRVQQVKEDRETERIEATTRHR